MLSNTRIFLDEKGREWRVTKTGPGGFKVMDNQGRDPRQLGEKLHGIARSCAKKLGVIKTSNGTPIEYVNEHIRIWNAIWER